MTKINLPFEDQQVWEYLRWYSYLSEKHKLLYISTPKVACTSLKWWFAAFEGYSKILSEVKESNQPDPDLVIHDSFHKVAPSVAGLMPEFLAKALVSDEFFRFAVVRNPYKRIFSAWQSKLLLREPFTADPYMKSDFFWMPVKNKKDIALAFEGFLEYLISYEAPNYLDPHWTPQVNLLRPDLIAYTNLSRIEDLKDLKLDLAKHLGPDIPDPFAAHRANESLIPYLPYFITERAGELIRTLYAEDFQTFGYDRQPPGAKAEFSESELGVAIQAIGLIRGRHQRLGETFRQLASLKQAVAERDGQLATLNQAMAERDRQLATLKQAMAERDGQLATLKQAVTERDRQIATLKQAVAERDRQIANFNQAMVERDGQIATLKQAVAERDGQLASLNTQFNTVFRSKAWHLIQTFWEIRSRIIRHKEDKKMKILFIGEVGSIHVARWVNQLHGTGWDFRVFQPVPSAYSVRGEFLSGRVYLPYDVHKPNSIQVEYTLSPKPPSLVTRAFRKGLRILKTSLDERPPSLAIRAIRKGLRMLKIMPLEESPTSPETLHARFLADLIRQWQPDVIHSLGMFVNWRDNAIVLLRAREMLGGKLPCPWIVSSWGIDMTLYPSLGEKERAAVEAILAVCDKLIVEGERDFASAQELGFRGEVIAKLPAYGGITWKPEDYRAPGLTSSRRVIILKGRDNTDHVLAGGDPQGRAMTAIKAFKICRDLLKSYSIVIAQATPTVEAEAKVLVAEGMDITIYPNSMSLPYEEWLKLLGSARILIAVTASDGLPSTLIEAMSLGVFPIHSGLEVVREWISDGENGLLVPPEDVQAVAQALRTALANDELVDKASELNLELIAKNLSDSVVRPQVIDLYKTLAQS